MQNPLAALSPIAPLADALGPASPTEVGDGSFGFTFGEVVLTPKPSEKLDEIAGLGFVPPLTWGAFLLASPDSGPLAEVASVTITNLPDTKNRVDGAPAHTLPATVEAAFGLTISHEIPQPKVSAVPASTEGAALRHPDEESGLMAGLTVADGNGPGNHLSQTVMVTLDNGPGVVLLTPALDVTTTAENIGTRPFGPAPAEIGKVIESTTAGPSATANEKRSSESAAAVLALGGSGGPSDPFPATAVILPIGPVVLADMGTEPLNQSARPSRPTPSLLVEPVQPEAAAAHPLLLDVAATLLRAEPLSTSAAEDLAGPTGHLSALQGPADSSTQVGQNQVDPDLSTVLPGKEETGHEPLVASFWERVFSDRSTSTRSTSRHQPDEPPRAITSLQAPALLDGGSIALSDEGLQLAPSTATPEKRSARERPPVPTPSSLVAWSRELLDDALTKALPRWALSDWQGVLSGPDQHAELFFSSLPALSQGQAPGSPTATAAAPHFPVPQIASQLASVLVRNESSMTELALAPEELGKVRLRMEPDSANPDRMIILISVERPETLDLLRRHAGELAEAMRNAGYSGADIGFGQNSQDTRPEHKNDPAPTGPEPPFEEVGPIETRQMQTLGLSLDLRL